MTLIGVVPAKAPAPLHDRPPAQATEAYAEVVRAMLLHLLDGQTDPHDVPAEAWPPLIAMACYERVAPLLYATLGGAPHAALPAVGNAQLGRQALDASSAYISLRQEMARVEQVLLAADVPTLWLKGLPLAARVYPHPALRPMVDLDVLVPMDDVPRALAALRAAGWQHSPPDAERLLPAEEPAMRYWNHHHVMVQPASGVTLELHNRLITEAQVFLTLADEAWFWAQSTPASVRDVTVRALLPEAQLLHLCAHALLHHTTFSALMLMDLVRLLRTQTLDWPLVVQQATHLRWTWLVERCLREVLFYAPTVPVPADVLDRLANGPGRAEEQARVAWLHTPRNLLQRTLVNLGKVPLRQRVRLIRLALLPTRAHMQELHATWHGPLAVQRVRHWGWLARTALTMQHTPSK